MNSEELALHIEALLFATGRPFTRKEMPAMLGVSAADLDNALRHLAAQSGRGVVLVDDGRTVELRAAPQAAALIEKVRKEEYSRDIGKAGLEALSAILYRGPLTRSQVDFIRGVNSSQTLRTLSMRGLVRKVPNPRDERQWLYEPTTELLADLGVVRTDDLPEYTHVRDKLSALETQYRQAAENAPAQADVE